MNTNKTIQQIITSRSSCRTYDPKPIPIEKMAQMMEWIDLANSEVKSKIRFTLLSTRSDGKEILVKLGSYGVISGAHTFLVAIIHETEGNPLELGMLFEKVVLKATELGLGTCWLGGTFNKGDFEKNFQLNPKEYIPIVSPLGIAKDKRSLLDTAMRFGAGSNNRKSWSELFFEADDQHPLTQDQAGAYSVPLEMVRIGPSASNKQPWRILKLDNVFHFYLARNSGYGEMMAYDLQLNDLGIAKCHFELCANELGLKGNWINHDPQKLIPGWEYKESWQII